MNKIIRGILSPHPRPRTHIRNRRNASSAMTINKVSGIGTLPASNTPYKFLIIRRLGGIGDVLMTTPMLRGLKEKFPRCHITYATNDKYAGGSLFAILQGNPYIDKLITVGESTQSRYDFTVDVTSIDIEAENKTKSPPNRIDIYCNYLGVNPSSYLPFYQVTSGERAMVNALLETQVSDLHSKRLIFINPASNTPRRDVPIDTIQKTINLLLENEQNEVIVSHHFDHGLSHTRLKKFICDIRTCAALMDRSDVVLSHDTGTIHLAGALNKKIVGLFGSINPGARLSHYPNASAIWKTQLPCVPCWYANCERKPQFECMKIISPREIAQAIEIALSNNIQTQNRVLLPNHIAGEFV